MADEFPHVDELSEVDFQTLKNGVSGVLRISDVGCFYDDHLPCVNFRANGVKASIWWLSVETAGAFYYPDSQKAMDVIREILADRLQQAEDDRGEE